MVRGDKNMAKAKRRRGRLRALAACAIVALACFTWFVASLEATAQSAVSVRAAVLDAAMQCAAVEGAYPSSLEYLEEHYGLIVNREDYVVIYEVFASNVPPSVVVTLR